MKFTPFKFQLTLAAGGVALMAYNLLLLALPHVERSFTISNIAWDKLSLGQTIMYYPLITIMLILTIINLLVIIVFIKQLIPWLFNKEEYTAFMSGPPTQSIGTFVPIAYLSMTACVIFGPVAFFIPELSSISTKVNFHQPNGVWSELWSAPKFWEIMFGENIILA